MPHATPEMIADETLGACSRGMWRYKEQPDLCYELGPYRSFYQAYVCDPCLAADQADMRAHRSPPGLFQKAPAGE